MDRKLSYKKLPGSLELGVEKPEKTVALHQSVVSMPMTPQIPSAYRKEDGMLSYSLICVISGGTKRERAFLNELERKHTFKAVDVIFISTEEGAGGLTPKMMLSAYECICQGNGGTGTCSATINAYAGTCLTCWMQEWHLPSSISILEEK